MKISKNMLWASLAAGLCLAVAACSESSTSGESVEPKTMDPANTVPAPGGTPATQQSS